MRVITAYSIAILFAVTPVDASANGNALIKGCKEAIHINDFGNPPPVSFVGAGICLGRIAGISDLNTIYEAKYPGSAIFCKPKAVTIEQMARVVTHYLEDHPERLHLDSSILVVLALVSAYPCNDKR